ncbi:MAG TPA: EamA family transporter [Actinomycetota bacterium]|nr:EamA family transporter [Actinomycetota bacterium]
MEPWTLPALFALVIWSVQRVVAKRVLEELATAQYYFLSAAVGLPVYLPVLVLDPPTASALPGALGVSALMALTFWVTTEALRRGPVSRVSPIAGLSPAVTAVLAVAFLGERPSGARAVGIGAAVAAVALLGWRRSGGSAARGPWLGLTVLSTALQGVGAFLAKVVVTPAGPSALLVTGAAVQLAVGGWLLRRERLPLPSLADRLARLTVLVLALAAVATIGYLVALARGPASVIVPLVATSPALGGALGLVALGERAGAPQLLGMVMGLGAAVLLAVPT